MKHIKPFNNFITEKDELLEGVNDPGILKAVFLAGGPGSGKSYVASNLFDFDESKFFNLTPSGLKVVNSDREFEYYMDKAGIDAKKLRTMSPAEFAEVTMGPDSPRGRAKTMKQKKEEMYKSGRLGMILDGTGDNYDKIANKRAKLEALGYDTYMLFVNTSLEVAQERNKARSRSLPEALVKEIWSDVQQNMGKFQQLFGQSNITVVDNTMAGLPGKEVRNAINKFVAAPLKNPVGKAWVKDQRAAIKR